MQTRLFSALVLSSTLAHAAIVNTSSLVEQITPPATVLNMTNYASVFGHATAWDEQQAVLSPSFGADLAGNPNSTSNPTSGLISGLLDSHYIHYYGGIVISGSVTFSGKIVGVSFLHQTLLLTDAMFQPAGTTYHFFPGSRGIDPLNESITVSQYTISFVLRGVPFNGDTSQIRVWTEHVPSPGTPTLAAVTLGFLSRRRRPAAVGNGFDECH